MKSILLILLLLCAASGDEALLKNGGFEKGLEPWFLINNSGTARCSLDKKNKKEGKQSLCLTKTGGPPMDTLRLNLGKLPAGKKVTVSAKFMASEVQNGWFKIFFYDAGGETIKQGGDLEALKGTYPWKEFEITNKVPEGTASAAVFILLMMPGELWIDDVNVTCPGLKGAPEEKERVKPLDRGVKTWLDRNAVKVKTLDFDGSLSDLRPLKKLLANARIVQLGEQSHGDGESFRAKARLVRFLHQEMGFDLLAFESGLFECELANALFEKGETEKGVQASVFAIWRVEEARPVFEYLARSAGSEKPLRLTGFDCRGSGGLAGEFVIRLLDFMAPAGAISTEERLALARIDEGLNEGSYGPDREARDEGLAVLKHLRSLFDKGWDQLVQVHGKREVAFYSHCLDNYAAREAFEYAKNELDPDRPGNMRDEQMAKNLRWLADFYYPDRKIITWAATSHQARNLTRVSIGGDSGTYKKWKNMGQYIHEWYGTGVYTIAFAAFEGEAGRFAPLFTLNEPQEGSLEDLFFRYGAPLLFVDLAASNPFDKPLHCSPMSYDRTMKAPWPEVVDAIFYIQEMTATRAINWN